MDRSLGGRGGPERLVRALWHTPYLFPFIFLFIFFALPLGYILSRSIWDGGFTLAYFRDIFDRALYSRVIRFTFYQAFLSTIVTLFIGIPAAWYFSEHDFRGKSFLRSASTIPFILPPVTVSLGFILLFGKKGILNSFLQDAFGLDTPPISVLYTLSGIVLVHAFYNFPVVMRIVSNALGNVPQSYIDASSSLGMSRAQTFLRVQLPLVRGSILASALLTYIYCFMSFAPILMIGGSTYASIEVEIYTLTNVFLETSTGAAFAVIQLLFASIMVFVYIMVSEKEARLLPSGPGDRGSSGGRHSFMGSAGRTLLRIPGYLLLGIVFFFIFAPMASIVYESFFYSGAFSIEGYGDAISTRYSSNIGIPPMRAILNSLVYSTTAMLLAILSGLTMLLSMDMLRRRYNIRNTERTLNLLFTLPIVISPITLGLGFIIVFSTVFHLSGVWLLIPALQSIFAIPFVIRVLYPAMKQLDSGLVDAAETLGASYEYTVRKVILPYLLPFIVVSGIFAFGISMGEFGGALILARSDQATMPVVIYSLAGIRRYQAATAMSVIFMGISLFVFAIIDRIRAVRLF